MGLSAHDELDIEDLARLVCGVSDYDDIHDAVFDHLDITIEDFITVVAALLPYTPVVQSALGGERYHAFVNQGAMVVRQKAPEGE